MMSDFSNIRLPVPSLTSGKDTACTIVSDGVIDWRWALNLWVHTMGSDSGTVYAPCVVFFDQTWLQLGPIGTLDVARRTCHALAIIHDSTVSDPTRPKPQPRWTDKTVVEFEIGEVEYDWPPASWDFDFTTKRCKLDLSVLGVEIAIKICDSENLDKRIDICDAEIAKIASAFRASGTVQPHHVPDWISKIRRAALLWLQETQWLVGDDIDTAEDDGRSMADFIRAEGVTFADAVYKLQERITAQYADMRWSDGALVAERDQMAARAFNAGKDRLLYFARSVAPLQKEGTH